MKMPTPAAIQALVKTITAPSSNLPSSVKQGSKSDKIWTVMNGGEGETLHETFNRRFDAMFGEDCCDSNGRLEYVCRGKLGLGLVCLYLSKIDWAVNFLLDLVEIKLQRLVSELKYLHESDAGSNTQTRPACHTIPTAKLTDENNLEQPKLPSQRKPVQALKHPKFKHMIDVALCATEGVKISGQKLTWAAIKQSFQTHLKNLKAELNGSKVSGEISLTCNAWQVGNMDGYFAVTGHWIEETAPMQWELKSTLVGFTWLCNAHNAEHLGQALSKLVD
ncbi:hypothetical protein E4T56_gene1377 [Termitomyces sp. T112]|nr:hypothetical protein E4T56_gene1377 [Termitomyces sp. T112]